MAYSMSCVRTRLGGEPVLQILNPEGAVIGYILYGDGSNDQHRIAYREANACVAGLNAEIQSGAE